MNLLFEIGVPVALVVFAALGLHFLRRSGKQLDEEKSTPKPAGLV